jgi:hypothetical protein
MSQSGTPRDPAKPAAYYHEFVAREQQAMRDYTQYSNPVLLASVAPKCVRIGVALYSAGAKTSECREWFGEAAAYQQRFLADGKQFKLAGPGTIDDYLELYSAAFLAGTSDSLIDTLQRCTYTETTHPAKTRLLMQFCDLLKRKPVDSNASEVAELRSIKKEWASLPVLFSAVSTKSISDAASALDDYLTNSWGPPIEKWAKKALKSGNPDYCGRWSVFSAAACSILGTVPDLGKKAAPYVPVDLVTG